MTKRIGDAWKIPGLVALMALFPSLAHATEQAANVPSVA